MSSRNTVLSLACLLVLAGLSGCIQTRSASVVSQGDKLCADTQALVDTLRSIRDESSAQASMAEVRERFASVVNSARNFLESAKHADKLGGVTKSAKDKIEAQTKKFLQVVSQVSPEVERLKKIQGLSKEFWMNLRLAQIKYLDEYATAFDKFVPANLAKFSHELAALSAKHSHDRVVQMEMEQGRGASGNDLASKIRAKLAPGGEVIFLGADGTFTFYAGPVDDFDAFRQSLDFLEITNADGTQLYMDIQPKAAAFAGMPSGLDPARSGMTGGRPDFDRMRAEALERMAEARRSASRPFGGRPSGAPSGEVADIVRDHMDTVAEMARPSSLPDESDPRYYHKLSDLLIDGQAHFTRDEAIAVLIGTNPEDIPDKELRKQIARNFRQLASDERGFDRDKAIRGLVIYGGKFSVPILIDLIEKERLRVEPVALDALAAIKDPKGAEVLVQQLDDFFNREAAISAIRKIGSVAEPALIKAAPSNDAKVSAAAVELLGDVGSEKSVMVLRRAQDSKNPDVKLAAANSLRQINERKRTGASIAADQPVDLFAMFSQPIPKRATTRRNLSPPKSADSATGAGDSVGADPPARSEPAPLPPALRRIN